MKGFFLFVFCFDSTCKCQQTNINNKVLRQKYQYKQEEYIYTSNNLKNKKN